MTFLQSKRGDNPQNKVFVKKILDKKMEKSPHHTTLNKSHKHNPLFYFNPNM